MNNIKILLLLFTLYSYPLQILAQPTWVDNKGSNYSNDRYVSGFGIATIDKDDDLDEIREKSFVNAKRDLTEKIKLSIQSKQSSTGRFETSGADGKSGNNYSEVFQSSVESFSSVQVVGLERLEHQDKKLYYNLVYAEKDKIYKEYKRNWDLINKDIKQTYDQAQQLVSSNKFEAQKKLLSCFKKIDYRNELESVIYAIGYKVEWDQDVVTYKHIKAAIEQIRQTKIESVKDLSFIIASNLTSQIKQVKGSVMVKPLRYQEANLPSPFSKYLKDYLETDLAANSSWKISQATQFKPNQKYNLVRGNYRKIGNNLEFRIFLQDPTSGVLASYQVSVPVSIVENTTLAYIPEAQDQFENMEELKPSGLKVDVWTNKGKDDLLFVEDEILKLGFKVNMPCYLRVVYYLADGSKVLFFDNYEVTAADVKNEIIYPEEFVCAEPFGIEKLQVFAKTTRFDPLVTSYQYGYTFIEDGRKSIAEKSRNTRGFKKTDYLAETRLTITTMGK